MTFDKFISQKVVQEKNYSWDVEADAMEWETAISGIKTMDRKIKELRKEGCV